MNTPQITLQATISPDRRLIVDLPDDLPEGPVELVIRPLAQATSTEPPLTHEEVRARLLAAGLLSTARYAPPGAVPLSDEELETLTNRLPRGKKTVDEMLDEDRQERMA